MRRKRRTEIIIEGARELATQFAKQIEQQQEVRIIVEPHHSLTMVKMREAAQQTLFYLGEVLVTECKVQVNDIFGVGIVIGMEEQLAYELAVIDAAYQANMKETIDWNQQLLSAEKHMNEQRLQKEALLQKTTVSFDTMEVQ